MWVMVPIVGGAAIAKKITNKTKGRRNDDDDEETFSNRRNALGKRNEEREEDDEEAGNENESFLSSPSSRRRRQLQNLHEDEGEGEDEDDEENNRYNNKSGRTPTVKNNNYYNNNNNNKRQPFAEKSINQFLPSINVEEMLSTLKKENFALECELGMMSATLEEETLRADALEEDLNNTRQTLQAVVERDTLSETGRLQDKLALAQDELILLNATVEEEFKKNDELREELKSVQNTLDEVVKREMATVRENEDLLRRSKFEINEELMIQNRKIETLEQANEQLEGKCATYETRIEKAKIEFEETLKKYSEANRVNLEKVENEKKKELVAMSKELEETKAELLESLKVIEELREDLVAARAIAERGGGGSMNTTADERDRESEHALHVANLAESLEEKEDEIQSLLAEISSSKRREESLRERVVSLSAEKVQRDQRGGHMRPVEDSFDDLSSTIDEEMLKAESSKAVNSASKASSSKGDENPSGSPTRRFGGLFGRNNNNNSSNSKNPTIADRVGSKNASSSSPLSEFTKDANETLLTPPISAMTPPTPPNVGSSATKRTSVLPSEMKEMQQKVQELVAKVDGATTPQGISNALRELEELQRKLSGIEFTPDSPPPPLPSSTKGDVMVTPPPTTSFNVNMSPSPPRSTRKSDGKQQQQNRSVDNRDKSADLVPASVASEMSPSSTTKERTLAEPWLGKSPTSKIKPLKKCIACQTGFPEPGKQFCMHCLTPPNKRGINQANNATTPPKEALEKKKKKMSALKMFSPKEKK